MELVPVFVFTLLIGFAAGWGARAYRSHRRRLNRL